MEIRKCDGREHNGYPAEHNGYPAEHNGYPAEHNGYPRQTGVGARDTCVSKKTSFERTVSKLTFLGQNMLVRPHGV